jgi:hypothetical protein
MTEAEWLACDDPVSLMDHLARRHPTRALRLLNHKLTREKGRLLLTGLARQVWDELKDDRSRRAVEVAELYARGEATEGELSGAYSQASYAREESWSSRILEARQLACDAVIWDDALDVTIEQILGSFGTEGFPDPEQFAGVIRCVFGNPFRAVSVDPGWLSSDVVALARGAYQDHAFDRLPVLADALQDAGCDNADLLGHLRGPGPHVRGCWALDLVLGKE